jgi:peptidoglycan DL-endopeptidase CwlO
MDIGNLSSVAAVWPVAGTTRETETGSTMTAAGGEAGRGGSNGTATDTAAANAAANTAAAATAATAPTADTILPLHQPDPQAPTGPPPAFSTTPLELDGNLQILLARLNAAGYSQVQALASGAEAAAAGQLAGAAPKGAAGAPRAENGIRTANAAGSEAATGQLSPQATGTSATALAGTATGATGRSAAPGR